MLKKIAAKVGLSLGVAALVVGGTSGTAGAVEGAGYVGYGYTTSGGAVWCAQTLVNDAARKAGRAQIAEDGQWGPKTDAQIRWYQQWTGSEVDGIVGPETGNLLLFFGDKDYGGEYGHCYWYLPSDWRLGAMGVPTHLT
ncbi:peptidoglycan-binding protein [Streptomyces sp. NBC_00094]|uniref:peptidoglycan-binding domain-containing protein n=1 Tax=Streptomyces sp. NBC_00094 TaxID=2903620 RepID=UPI002255CAAF|nr:peptidoglycan-binding domain-containing protein [Streptomyces sp. NBC_00094]MCX5392097.1 peptidoglycan-binding protein [Streptomyces sp. NBC_00094]